MKKIIIGLLALVNIVSANASMLDINGPLDVKLSNAQVEQDKTYFETLGDLFQTGTRPELSKISNIAWAGRCFLSDKPNDPTNSGYIFRQKRSSDVGPIGVNAKRTYEAISYWSLNEATDVYDHMSLNEVLATINATAQDAKINSNTIEISSRDLRSNLKISGSYLVEELTRASDAGPIAKTSAYARCYYFIPEITNNY